MHRWRAVPVALCVALLIQWLGATPASATTASSRSILLALPVTAEVGASTYQRSYFKLWVDADHDCQNTRAEVLIAETRAPVTFTTSYHCTVKTGRWFSPYDNATWTLASDVDIDHLVPLAEAWKSGARLWSAWNRERYANDLGFYATLIAVTDNVNQAKGDRDPSQWLPPVTAYRCQYAMNWVQVKYRWRLSVNQAERNTLSAILSGTCGSKIITVPPRAI